MCCFAFFNDTTRSSLALLIFNSTLGCVFGVRFYISRTNQINRTHNPNDDGSLSECHVSLCWSECRCLAPKREHTRTHNGEREDCAYRTFDSKLVEQGVSIALTMAVAVVVVVVVVVVIVVVVNTDGKEYNATLHANANNTLTR